jgi:PAS domain S-box-containing protein
MDGNGYQKRHPHPEDRKYLEWAGRIENKNDIWTREIRPATHEGDYRTLVMELAIPVWQVSVDESHPVRTGKFSGVIIFYFDTTALVEKVIQDIRSGKTGYAWVIDQQGTFLYHPEREFIGKNAFEARREKRSTISFDRINEIQKELMLAGKEGASWYVSGWHRGKEGEMKKLIAYTPVRLMSSETQFWSVAVVAPISEVEGAIGEIQARQNILEGIIIFAVIAGGIMTFTLLVRLSSSLKEEVQRKTEELRQSENQYASLVEHANDIIFTVDRNANFLTINKAGVDFFNRTKEEIIGHNIGTICFNEESASRQFKAIDEVIASGESRQIIYATHIKDTEYWLSTNFGPLSDINGKIYAVLAISRDVTERKRTEDRMYHTEKLASLGTLAAGVAHEINNPLAIILGFTDILLEKTDPGSESFDILKTIEKQGNNAKRVVENLLSFARYREIREESIDINSSIEEVLTVAGNTLRVSKITVRKRLSSGLPLVKGDSREIQQVFLNIINNAIYAMKGNGMLTVETDATANGRRVEIRFSDSGHGIRKEHRTRIFDPLFTTKVVGEGTGLGLSVCYAIIAKYGGSITFETRTEEESPNTGTTFIISLPSADR